jgi:N-acetylglucosamine malate deacetylase 1
MNAPLDLLALAAHPDDAEAGCGGTLARAVADGRTVGIADLTAGELSTHGDPATRTAERDRASQILGLAVRVGLGLPDGGLEDSAAHRDALTELLRELRPRVLLAPYPQDRHPDHAAAGTLARATAFLAGVGRYRPGREPHRPAVVYHYMLHHPFTPSFVVDVGPVWERRAAAVAAYDSQFGGAAADARTAIAGGTFLELLDARARFYGAMIGADRGEPFWSPGPIGLDAPPDGGRRGYRMFL